ncbi:helix-turn-helix domain-containing protein [Streptomyces diastaticus]
MSTPTAPPPTRRLLRVEDAATTLGFKRSTAYEEIRRGRLRTVQVGRRRLIPTEYIEEYIELLKRESHNH